MKRKNQDEALSALMSCDTLSAAAKEAGIDRRTLYGYLHDDEAFARAYQQKRELAALERAEQYREQRQQAVDVIVSIMNDESQPGAVRLKAAAQLLDAVSADVQRADKIAVDNLHDIKARGVFGDIML